MVRFLCAISLAIAAGISPSLAADRREAPPYYLPPPPPVIVAPPYSWSGPYLGLNAGWGWANSDFGNADGFVGGGQIGINWQAPGTPFVFGVEGDFQGADVSSSATAGGVTATAKMNAFATARGRIGFAFDRFMAYGTGGWAYTHTELSATGGGSTVSGSDWSSGYVLGGGVEAGLWNRFSARIEYLYLHSGDVTVTVAGTTVSGDYNVNIVRAGLNYRF